MTPYPSDNAPARLTAFFLLGLFAVSFVHIPVSDSIIASHRGLYPMVSTAPAKIFYFSLLICIAVGCLARARAIPSRGVCVPAAPQRRPLSVLGALAMIFALGEPVSIPFLLGFWCTVGFALLISCDSVRFRLARRFVRLVVPFASWIVLALFGFYCIALPFVTPVVASEGAQLVSLQNHYIGYMPGLVRAALGDQAMIGVLNYGAGSAILVEAIVRLARGCDVVFAIKSIQVGMLVVLGGVLFLVRRSAAVPLFALLVLASPTMSLLSPVLYYPNLSLIRFAPFVVTVGALAISSSLRTPCRWPLTALAALAALYAPETGLVACGAILIFIFLREVNARGCNQGLRTALLSAVAIGLAVVLARESSQLSDAHHRVLPSSTFFFDFIGGYCGISAWPSPLSVVAFFCGVHAVYRGACRAAGQRLGRWDAYQAAVGVMLLGWLFYYVHRMHPYNLYFQGALIVLLCAPRLSLSILRARSSGGMLYGVLLAATLVGLSCETWATSVRDAREFSARRIAAIREPALETDMKLLAPYATSVARQVAALRPLEPRSDYLVLTNLSVEARSLGFNALFPYLDPFIDVVSVESMSALVRWINERGPFLVVVDDPGSDLARSVPHQTRHLQEIIAGLFAYRRVKGEHGWIYYERLDSPSMGGAPPG